MPHTASDRRFSVHAGHIDRHHGRVITERSFEAAAVAYIEDFPHATGAESGISVIVRDIDTGHEHCFRVDLETGETVACS